MGVVCIPDFTAYETEEDMAGDTSIPETDPVWKSFEVDAATGCYIEPDTGKLLDPETGEYVDEEYAPIY